jgi:hypothetical protein
MILMVLFYGGSLVAKGEMTGGQVSFSQNN